MVPESQWLILGKFQEKGSVIVFVHKHEVADALLREVMRVSYLFTADKVWVIISVSMASRENFSRPDKNVTFFHRKLL